MSKLDPWNDPLEKLQADYSAGLYQGIPTRLFQYAQNNPAAQIDTSGYNRAPTDPMFNFYNPLPGQTLGVNWFPTDDRNNPMLPGFDPTKAAPGNPNTGSLYTAALAANPANPAAPTGTNIIRQDPIKLLPGTDQYQKSPMPTAAAGTTQAVTQPTGLPSPIRLRMPDGTEQVFSSIDASLDAALKAGGRPLRPNNTLASLSQFGGGWLVDNQPLNQWMGGQLQPDQLSALQTAGLLPLNVDATGNTQQRTTSLIQAALAAGQGGAATLASGVQPQYQALLDLFNNLLTNDADFRNQMFQSQLGMTNSALQQIMAQGNTGLPDATKAALTTQALEQVPGQFARSKQDLRTRMLRGGSANMPLGGDFLRNYAPLEAAEQSTRAGLLRDVVLADEKARQENLNRALSAAGVSAGLSGTIAGAFDPARFTSGLLGSAGGLLNAVNSMTASQFQGLDLATKLTAIGQNMEAANLKLPILASLLSAGLMGGKDSLIQRGIGGLIDIFTGGGDSSTGNNGDGGGGAGGGTAGLGNFAGNIWDGLKTIGGAIGGALSTAAAALASNPWTIGIAGAVAGAAMWLKSQAHWEANTIVQNLEDPFHYEYLSPFVDQFTQAFTSGNMTKAQAQQAKEAFLQTWAYYQQRANEFGQGGSDEAKVAKQSIDNLKRVAIDPILASIDAAIEALG